jgi:hypothetical protein
MKCRALPTARLRSLIAHPGRGAGLMGRIVGPSPAFCLLSSNEPLSLSDRHGEGFRMPSGVGKPPKHEPAGLR